ncbi:MAG TPA: hypothetical protein VER96_41215 [Polyangiaceae bacterium]|nr:hypothetical protein [Polyangiaceae bacterium]
MGSRLTDADTGVARQEVVVSSTLLSRVPSITTENISTAEELLAVMVKQSPYEPEEAVYILKTPPRPTPPEYKVVHTRAKASLLSQDINDPRVGIDFAEAAIDAAAVQAIEHSWGTMALRARWPDREHAIAQMKLGGVRYAFDYRGDNVYGQAATVSPQRGTCTGALAAVAELLGRYADERESEKASPARDSCSRPWL